MGFDTPKEKVERHKELFDSIDEDGCGHITLADFERAMQKTDHPLKDSPYAMSKIYEAFVNTPDTDLDPEAKKPGDKYIDFNQFNGYLMTAEDQIERGFVNVDKDHDGIVTESDVGSYLKRMGVKPTQEELDHFFDNVDRNHQGYITFEEFRDGLLFMPRINGSRIRTAFRFFNDAFENITSEGDVTVGTDIRQSVGYFLAGGLSGVVSRTCTAPLDRVKVFLIARTDLNSTFLNARTVIQEKAEAKEHRHVSKSKIQSPFMRAVRTLYRQGGLKAFYLGNGLNVLKVFPESAMKFGSFEAAKRAMCRIEGVEDERELSKRATYLSGGIGGVIAQCTVYPIDTLKYRMQCANLGGDTGHQLLINTAKEMYQEGGIRMFYRGLYVGLAGMFPYAAMDLGTFTSLKRWYTNRVALREGIPYDEVAIPNYMVLTMGASSGAFGASIVYPINLTRTRLQTQGTYAHPFTYNGFFDCARQTVKREGVQGLYKGVVPNLLKVIPAVSISYLMYENLKKLFKLE